MTLDRQPVGLRAGTYRAVAAATTLALAAAGCSYQSTYVAPQDGRARVVWGPGDVPLMELPGGEISGECTAELRNVIAPGRPPRRHVELNLGQPQTIYVYGGSGYWAPRYYGPPIVVARPGVAPPFARAPVFVPRSAFPAPMGGHPIGSVGSIGHATGGAVHGGGGGGGGGGGKEAGAILVVLAVIAATALPAVALGLAASMPESSSKSSSAIDMVNAYNDLTRLDGTPCTPPPYFAPGEFPPPQEQPQ